MGTALAELREMTVQSSVFPLAAIEQPPKPARAQWKAVVHCPSCGSGGSASRAGLPDRCYPFGSERIAYPEQGIAVVECESCGLFYKSAVPTPAFLADVFRRQAQAKWASSHDFLPEVALLRQLRRSGEPFDLLDVGTAEGALLAASDGIARRRSALDVMLYKGVERHLSGEFIEGFLDHPLPAWSNEPYDVVTLFDILEHLYEPGVAFDNLRSLLRKNGLAFIETGNSASFWPSRVGINHWWYVRLLEHHIFWSRRSLERAATAHGFRIAYWREVRHKNRRRLIPLRALVGVLKTGLYIATNSYYSSIANLFGREGSQPVYPFSVDHFQACLVKE